MAERLREQPNAGIDGFLAGRLYDRYVKGGPEPEWPALLGYAEATLADLALVQLACAETLRIAGR